MNSCRLRLVFTFAAVVVDWLAAIPEDEAAAVAAVDEAVIEVEKDEFDDPRMEDEQPTPATPSLAEIMWLK